MLFLIISNVPFTQDLSRSQI